MRIFNRLLALVLSLAILVVGVIFIVEVIAANTNRGPAIFDWHAMFRWGQRNTWQATSVEITCGIVALAGLLLLLPQLRRRRPNRFELATDHPATDAAVTRKGLRNAMGGAVADVEGVTGSRVHVGRRRIRIDASTSARTPDGTAGVEPAVQQAADELVSQLKLTGPRRVAVSVSQPKGAGS